ncbi:MBL fold metallo-hydrolase [Sporosarcina ureilytica]|uniref:Metallo-beta-lactamase domain-containing protein n=1 Tax=Sporosarcina ureilytica TaxID=298596 RepID=A0A1D8JEF3_9BACL|nr:MBL fold metallo-hydrolase [Sporosarcina ureilytica]AOV07079.1 hypothetical protein BI350_05645 [Sporosarcina ureilytica]
MRRFLFFPLLLLSAWLLASCTHDVTPSTVEKIDENNRQEAFFEETSPSLRVHYINVGQADATLLQLVDEEEAFNILIDTGDWNANDVVNYLQKEKISEIDLITITHPHADHIGQLDKIINTFNVGEVWMNGDTMNSQVFLNALEAIEKNGVDYYEPRAGETFDIGALQIDVVHPMDLSLNTNSNSIVIRIQYGDIAFLFTGDAERAAEDKMLASGANLNAHILHLGHHGSKTSTSVPFLEAVNPEVAIYSAGMNNAYGLPDMEVIERVNAHHTIVYGTDQYGTILVETDGHKYHIMTEKQGTLPPPVLGDTCININTASTEDLQQIIHIGEKTAAELVRLRPYQTLNDLLTISGIGEKRLEDIKDQNLACIGG